MTEAIKLIRTDLAMIAAMTTPGRAAFKQMIDAEAQRESCEWVVFRAKRKTVRYNAGDLVLAIERNLSPKREAR